MSTTLLLISENETLRGELQFHLNHMAPHQFRLVRKSAHSALNIIDAITIEDLPACIFIDVQYPLVGLSTMKSIRQRDPQFKLPVVALVATSITRTSIFLHVMNQALYTYACLVIHRPLSHVSLQQVIEKLKNHQ